MKINYGACPPAGGIGAKWRFKKCGGSRRDTHFLNTTLAKRTPMSTGWGTWLNN